MLYTSKMYINPSIQKNHGLTIYLITQGTMFILWKQESYIECSHCDGENYEENES